MEYLILILLGFPLGALFAVFLRWLSWQKKDLRSQQGVANGWIGLAGAVIINLLMAHGRAARLPAQPTRSAEGNC